MLVNAKRLPFAVYSDDGKINDFWNVAETGNWAADNNLGREYARVFEEFASESNDRLLFGKIIQGMVLKGRYAGPEVGFCAYISARI